MAGVAQCCPAGVWLEKHVYTVVRDLEAAGLITYDLVPGKSAARSFTIVANPVLRLARQ
jgi:hypothetical protein